MSIMVVSYNTRELTLACLQSVLDQTAGVDYVLIVVDNASADGSADAIARQIPSATLIALNENVGFARANNLAARRATGEFLLLLNPDTLLLDGAAGRALAFAQANPSAGIVGGRTFFADMSLNPTSCHGRPTPWSLLCIGTGLAKLFPRNRWFDPESLGSWQRNTPRQVDVVTGCFCLIRRSLWDALGGFDEDFFMYGEDTDLCIRARKAGSTCMICPDAKVMHYGGQSEKARADKMIRLFRAKSQLFRKHWSHGEQRFGLAMLKLWAFTRMAALKLLSAGAPAFEGSYQTWREIWHRRREFAE